jgi:hypothetical protein
VTYTSTQESHARARIMVVEAAHPEKAGREAYVRVREADYRCGVCLAQITRQPDAWVHA